MARSPSGGARSPVHRQPDPLLQGASHPCHVRCGEGDQGTRQHGNGPEGGGGGGGGAKGV